MQLSHPEQTLISPMLPFMKQSGFNTLAIPIHNDIITIPVYITFRIIRGTINLL